MAYPFSRVAVAGLMLAFYLPAAWAQVPDFRFGSTALASQAERSITIVTDTPWVNVRQGESVRFVAGPNEFGWKFDGAASAFDLMRVAPAGFLNRSLTVYVMQVSRGRGN